MIIDTHAHMLDSKFNSDREIIIKKAFGSDVGIFFEIACEMSYWSRALEFSKRDNVFVSFGIHPIYASKVTKEDYNKLEILVQNRKCIAIGEMGLDYHYDSSLKSINAQKESLIKQLNIAFKYDKPVIIHCRDAYDDMINFLKGYNRVHKGVIHCFSGTLEQAKMFLEIGFLLGVDGPVTYKKSDNLNRVISGINIDKLLLETDCPYLAPQKYRGQRNELSYIVEIVKEVGIIKNISFNEVARITAQNTIKLFKII